MCFFSIFLLLTVKDNNMSAINPRKSVTLTNRSNYFNPDKDKATVTFSSDKTYQSRESKIEGYENRMYWEYRYCEENSGQSFFYTFTYNDAHLPHFEGQACFDYEDLVDLLNGGLKKQLIRNYGTNFKYFVGAELGDGKGERGMHNNPHYHIIFFLRPDETYSKYKEITPKEFRHLCRMYWQGFDQDEAPQDYRTAKYGIVKEGHHIGKVQDFRAISYVSKYVCKDSALKQHEDVIEKKFTFRYLREVPSQPETKVAFYYDFINSRYNIPTKAHLDTTDHTDWLFSPDSLLAYYDEEAYAEWHSKTDLPCPIANVVDALIKSQRLHSEYDSYCREIVALKVKEKINLFRNRYSNKCRVSQGLGDYALEHISDKMNPRIEVPDKDGIKKRPIGLYYYRKLYTDVVKDAKGQNVYVLNNLGQEYKSYRLPKQMKKLQDNTLANLSVLDETLYYRMLHSDVNTDVSMPYSRFSALLRANDINQTLKRYAEYKLVYEGRFLRIPADRDDSECNFRDIDVLSDYKRFLVPSIYTAPYNPCGVTDFLDSDCEGYISYSAHPYFLPYIRVFAVFDLLADYLFCEADELAQQKAEEIAKTKRFHTQLALKQFYSQFNAA